MAIDDNTSYELTGYQVKDLANKVRSKADTASLASVATSGLYSDLTGKPTIPTVNNGTLTIQHNGSNVQTFTANQSTNATANVETIYSVDVSSTQPITQVVSTAMIQDEAVTTAKIDDEAVTAAKIDWSSVGGTLMYVARFPIHRQTYNNSYFVFDAPSVLVQIDANISVSRASSNTHLQFDLPATGTYAAHVSTQLWTNGNSWDYMLLEVKKNGDGFTRVMAPKISGTWGFCATQGWQSVVDGDYISEYFNTNSNNYSDGNMSVRDSYIDIAIYRVG